jgi:uncharacterized protein YbjT (DUF2867 family)
MTGMHGTVAVVGGTGQIGAEVVRLLQDADVPVRMLVRPTSTAALPSGADVVRGDLREPPDALFDGVDTLFVVSSDVDGERHLVRAAEGAGVRRAVKSSAIGFRNRAPAGHAAVEAEIAESLPSWTVVRPNAFMQTLAGYLPQLLGDDGVIRLPAGDGRTAWVDARDIGALCAAVVLQPPPAPGVLTATGPEALDMHAVADAFASALRRPVRYEPTDPADALPALEERLGPMAEFLVQHYTAVARGGFDQVSDDVETLTGRPPRPLAAFLAEQPPAPLPGTA